MSTETTTSDRIRGLSLAGLLLLTGGACAVAWLIQTGEPFGPDLRSVFYRSGMAIPVLADEGFAMIGLAVCAFYAVGAAAAVAGTSFLLGRTGVRVTAGIACFGQLGLVLLTLGWMFAFITILGDVGREPGQHPVPDEPGITAEIAAEAIDDFRRALGDRRGPVAPDDDRDFVLLHGPGLQGEPPAALPEPERARELPGFLLLPARAAEDLDSLDGSFSVWPEGEVVDATADYTRLTVQGDTPASRVARIARTQPVRGGAEGDPYSYALVVSRAPERELGRPGLAGAGYRIDVLVFRDFEPGAADDDAALVDRFVATVIR